MKCLKTDYIQFTFEKLNSGETVQPEKIINFFSIVRKKENVISYNIHNLIFFFYLRKGIFVLHRVT